jgi:ligand-binding SRPBCC domain-containing protein
MADHVWESRVVVLRPRDAVFAFLADPWAAVRLAPPGLDVRLLTPDAPPRAGAVYDYVVGCAGLRVRWRTYVREYDPPHRFVAVQVRGPWARWEHRHRLLEVPGGTWLEDRVTYRPPGGPLGDLAHVLLLRRRVRAAWAHRERRLETLLGPLRPAAG